MNLKSKMNSIATQSCTDKCTVNENLVKPETGARSKVKSMIKQERHNSKSSDSESNSEIVSSSNDDIDSSQLSSDESSSENEEKSHKKKRSHRSSMRKLLDKIDVRQLPKLEAFTEDSGQN